MNMKEIKEMNESTVRAKIQEIKKSLFELNLKKSTTGTEKSHVKTEQKRTIARLFTVLNEKSRK